MLKSKGFWAFFLAFLGICSIIPIYFIADDWEHLNWFHLGEPPHTLIQLFYRNPSLYFLHQLIFPIFAREYFFMGKLICYAFLVGAMVFSCDLYLANFFSKMRTHILWALLPLFMAFAPNHYEWNYWPTNMTCLPPLFFMTFTLWGEKKYRNIFWSIAKYSSYLFASFTFESLLPLAILLELSYLLFVEKEEAWSLIIKKILKRILPLIIIFLLIKLKLNAIAPFPYASQVGFKPHLFLQWLALFFSHDYYKTRHLTGSVSVLTIVTILCYGYKTLNIKNKKKWVFLGLCLVLGCSYYWTLMDYSSRRALGGQLYFFWGCLSLYVFILLERFKILPRVIQLTLIIFISITFVHHTYLFKEKYEEKRIIEENANRAREKVDGHLGAALRFDINFPKKNLGRAWNFIGVRQLNGFLRHYLTPAQQEKIDFGDDRHRRIIPPLPWANKKD